MVGAEGFKLMNFHFEFGGMRLGLRFIMLLLWFWKDLVGLVVDVRKLFLSMKFCTLVLYCCIGSTTREFPLSAEVIMASLDLSFFLIDLKVLSSGCVFLWGVGLAWSSSMRMATCFLK